MAAASPRPLRRLALLCVLPLVAGTLGLLGAPPAHASAPSNDDLANATALASNTPVGGSTDEATAEPGETRCPDHSDATNGTALRTVWYRYTVPADQHVSFQTSAIGDNLDTVITLYSAATTAIDVADLSYVGCNDDGPWTTSFLPATLTAGTTYYLQVDQYDDSLPPGGFDVRVNVPGAPPTSPPNDNLVAASRLIPTVDRTTDTRAATTEAAEPQQASCAAVTDHTVWYHFTPSTSRVFEVGTVGADGSVVNVYSGPANATALHLSPVACDSSSFGDGKTDFNGDAHTDYYIQIGSPASPGSAQVTVYLEEGNWLEFSRLSATGTAHGQTVALSASVAPDPYAGDSVTEAPSGTVEFLEGDVSLGSKPLTGTTASLTLNGVAPGEHTYLLLFSNADGYYVDSFRYLTVSVPPPAPAPRLATTLKVTAPKKVIVRAKRTASGKLKVKPTKVRVTTSVSAGGLPASGRVVIRAGRKTVTTALRHGVATIRVRLKKTTMVTVSYAGSGHALPATGKARIKVVVKKPAT